MKIMIVSIHPIGDNRISRQILTLLKENYEVEYYNFSKNEYRSSAKKEEKYRLVQKEIELSKRNPIGILEINFILLIAMITTKANIIHIHDPLLLPIVIIAKIRHIKVVYDRHESFDKIKGLNGKLCLIAERIFKRYIDGVVLVNSEQLNYVKELSKNKYAIIPNYQSLKMYDSVKYVKEKEKIKFVYIGSLDEKTRKIIFMLKVIEEVLNKNKNTYFFIGGTTKDDNISKLIKKLEDDYNRFIYLGKVQYNNVIKITKEADIGLYFAKNVPNNKNSSPNKVFEYMNSGIAIIGVGVFNHIEEINENAGKIFSYDTKIDEVVNYIIEVINDKKRLEKFKKNARKIGEKYCWETVESKYIELYQNIYTNK